MMLQQLNFAPADRILAEVRSEYTLSTDTSTWEDVAWRGTGKKQASIFR